MKNTLSIYWKSNCLFVRLIGSMLCLMVAAACATPSAQLPAPPPKYVYQYDEPRETETANSLWKDGANIFEDRKARRINDILTINIVESISGSGKADTNTKRNSTGDYGLDNMLGMKKNYETGTIPFIKDVYEKGAQFDPSAKGSAASQFKGDGDTSRESELVATVTARVVEVLPNGYLILAARKELTINNEKQILVLSGTVRPDDISADNTVYSNKLADAKVYYVGDGVIQDKQKPGWLVRALDKVWPF
ncbi:MAG: flagellar basal body L-ring protein FlgH [Nitrospirota bacterium]|nr:flagellar basal body L-ring protein FlgH [Nitrospirota bacterium]